MNFLKKINKGLVLTIVALIILIVYLANIEGKRNAEKPNIETAIKEYIEIIDKYVVLPSEDQKLYETTFNQEELDKISEEYGKVIQSRVNAFEDEAKSKMVENNVVRDIQKSLLEMLLTENNDFQKGVLTSYNKELTRIKKYAFDEDQVVVTFDSKVEKETKYLEAGEEKTKKDTQNISEESITLKNEERKWKIVYADFQYGATTNMFF